MTSSLPLAMADLPAPDLTAGDRHAVTARRFAVLLSAGLAVSAAMIHLSATVDHLNEWWVYSAFFAALAPAQVAWAYVIVTRPSQRSLRLGLWVNAVVVCVWAISRTTGIPIGPEAWHPESLGLLDALATLDEIAIIALLAGTLRFPAVRPSITRLRPQRAAAFAAPLLIVTSLIVFLLGAHAG